MLNYSGKIKEEADGLCDLTSQIKKAILPDSLGDIGNRAFEGCGELEDIIIPDNVTTIGNGAFAACEKLAEYVKERIRGITPATIMYTI